jgi:hypothetical protein
VVGVAGVCERAERLRVTRAGTSLELCSFAAFLPLVLLLLLVSLGELLSSRV